MCKAVQWFRRQDQRVRTKYRHSRRSFVFTVSYKAQSSEVWYSLFLTRLSRAKYSISCVLECSAEQSYFGRLTRAKYTTYGVSESSAQQKHGVYCVLEGSVEQGMSFTKSSQAQPIQIWYLLCRGRLTRAKYAIYGVREGSAEQKHGIYCASEGWTDQSMYFRTFTLSIFTLNC